MQVAPTLRHVGREPFDVEAVVAEVGLDRAPHLIEDLWSAGSTSTGDAWIVSGALTLANRSRSRHYQVRRPADSTGSTQSDGVILASLRDRV